MMANDDSQKMVKNTFYVVIPDLWWLHMATMTSSPLDFARPAAFSSAPAKAFSRKLCHEMPRTDDLDASSGKGFQGLPGWLHLRSDFFAFSVRKPRHPTRQGPDLISKCFIYVPGVIRRIQISPGRSSLRPAVINIALDRPTEVFIACRKCRCSSDGFMPWSQKLTTQPSSTVIFHICRDGHPMLHVLKEWRMNRINQR